MDSVPALLQARRRLAGEVLSAAATHSALCDELADLEARERAGTATPEDRAALHTLRERRRQARRHHDAAARRLHEVAVALRRAAVDAKRP